MLGLTIQKSGSPEFSISEAKCHYLDNGACDQCTCDKCTGGLIIDKERGVARDCSCKVEAINRLRLKRAGLPEEYTFDKYKEADAKRKTVKEKALAFVSDNTGKWFFIGGQSGFGKTHICSAIARELMKSGKTFRPFRWVDHGRKLKALANEQEYDNAIEPFLDVDVLFIDDFLKTTTQADVNLAMRLLDERYNRRRVTMISSERSLSDIARMIDGEGEAVAGRIKEMCGEYCIIVPHDQRLNWRFNGAKEK